MLSRVPEGSRGAGEDSEAALAISRQLQALIRDEIAAAGGWLSFARFMALALYAPGLGYYSAGATKVGLGFGDGSDFVTAPELTPLFARALARSVADILAAGGATVLELGGGSGRLAADLLLALEALDALPERYDLLDVSADFRERQRATLEARAPHLVDRVRWLDALPDRIDGAVIANEVLDALPVELVVRTLGGWQARGIVVVDDRLAFAERPLDSTLSTLVERTIPTAIESPGYLTEVHPAADGLVASIVSRLSATAMALLIDYGFPESEYYHPQRSTGTLVAHRRHRVSVDVLGHLGLQDLTAHVNFSGVARAAEAAGGRVVGYSSQSAFLIGCGIVDLLTGDAGDAAGWAPQASALQRLLSEAEMGELFKVIGLSRGPREAVGFGRSDRRQAL